MFTCHSWIILTLFSYSIDICSFLFFLLFRHHFTSFLYTNSFSSTCTSTFLQPHFVQQQPISISTTPPFYNDRLFISFTLLHNYARSFYLCYYSVFPSIKMHVTSVSWWYTVCCGCDRSEPFYTVRIHVYLVLYSTNYVCVF